MRKYITIILTLTLAACSKSTVTYDEPGAIAIQPVSEGMTKAAVGVIPEGQDLLIYANYVDKGDSDKNPGDAYLNAAVFAEIKDAQGKGTGIWAGAQQDYFWPKSGTISLAGCTALPSEVGSVVYSYSANTFTVADYTQPLNTAETVDFIWFNHQKDGVNLARTNGNLAVEMKHALTWVTIQVKGLGGSVGWKVESIKLLGVQDKGELTCKTSGAEWKIVGKTDQTEGATDITVYIAPVVGETTNYFTLDSQPKDIETTPKGTVLIPQTPVEMEVKYHTTDSPSPETLRTKKLNLWDSENTTDISWEAGKHYTYTITFNPYMITFTVDTDDKWGDENKDVNEYDDEEIEEQLN